MHGATLAQVASPTPLTHFAAVARVLEAVRGPGGGEEQEEAGEKQGLGPSYRRHGGWL